MRSLLFNISFYIFTGIVALLAIPLLLVPGRRPLAWAMRQWARGCVFLMRWFGGMDVEFRGLERLPKDRGVILAGKHQSEADGILVLAAVPGLTFIAMKQLLNYPLIGLMLKKTRMIMVATCGGDTQRDLVNEGAKAVAASGRSILIYPEGRLTPVGTYVPYRKSIWHMYQETGLAVVPVPTNIGLRWPQRDWIKSPGPAAIEFLDPIEPGLGKAEFMKRLEHEMESATSRLVREHGGEPYDMPIVWEQGVQGMDTEKVEASVSSAA